jgi:hypothetical protein
VPDFIGYETNEIGILLFELKIGGFKNVIIYKSLLSGIPSYI